MERKISIKMTFDSFSTSERVFNIEDFCPHCGKTVCLEVINYTSSTKEKTEFNSVGFFLQCPSCRKFSIQEFPVITTGSPHYRIETIGKKIVYTYKVKLKNNLPELVNDKFPSFREIYDQSLEAESQGLDQIAGVGFRKSIEFLIKEYAIFKHPDEKATIEKKFLGNVINDYLTDFPKVQALAKAAVWIGNDETHFVRKHENKDINDMKKFLSATAQFISADLTAEDALEFTTDSQKN